MTPGRVPATALQGGDIVLLPLPEGDELCEVRRIIMPVSSLLVLIDFRLACGTTGTCRLLGTDAVLRVRENTVVAA